MKRLVASTLILLAAGSAQAQNVLVYDNNTKDNVAATACNNLGYTCTVAGQADFTAQLTGGTWDVVVMDLPSTRPDGDWQTAMADYIGSGGLAIQSGWDSDDFTSLAGEFEVILDAEKQPSAIYRWNDSSLFTTSNPVPSPLAPAGDDWGTNGFFLSLTPAGSGVAHAGFVASPTAGQAAVVVGNSGRTIFNGLLFDDFYPGDADTSGKADIVEFVENQMQSVLGADLDTALFRVTKTFSDGNDAEVEVTLSCNAGLPLEQSYTIAGGDKQGVTFVVTNIPESGADCEVTETGGPAGYTSSGGCEWTDVVVGRFSCAITNTADDATYTVVKDWVQERTGGDVINAVAKVSITCDREIRGVSEDSGSWTKTGNLSDGGTLVAKVDVTTDSATCSASEEITQSGVESVADGCGEVQLGAGGSHTCTFTNTVFFEGIPTLSQYGLALLALLMLGVGFVGMRRFV